jgi:hypothetical protein
MKIKHPPLFLSLCLAFGGIGTVGVICFFIGFGLHSLVGKYAIYTAFFLEVMSLVADRLANKGYVRLQNQYSPSRKMKQIRLYSTVLWLLGAVALLLSLALILFGMGMARPLPRFLCVTGCVLAPTGWMGILIASHRQRQALQVLNTQSPLR